MPKNNALKKRLKSFAFAFTGIRKALGSQPNMQIHAVVFILVVAAGFFFEISVSEWIAILLVSALVFSLELINTAVEEYLDAYHPEVHPVTGRVKDIAAGAVLVSAIAAAVIGALIFIPKIIVLL